MKVINQRFETLESFGFTIGQIDLKSKFDIQCLINEGIFDVEIRPSIVKESFRQKGVNNDFLIGLFCSEELSVSDFKYIPDDAIYYYLEGFSESEEEWGEDKVVFKKLLEIFKNMTEGSIDGCYIINKEWFSVDSHKVRDNEFSIYDIYFIIIWVDKNDSSKVFISEWCSD
ncbi:hypothetical protein GO491_02980 [Flavobacteriaceae bacterium Ap0902]|nr:hypothetical protein [Flavobacteriaceae bacterium Ap0902]